ncbi:MAG: class I SAM-dependent methyltransferase [Pseudomonadota bacterium]|nr:class I SAM-dependent methyltransferase [Pseudomonadota bacterium]
MPQWLESPAGEYLLAWEQRHLDQAVADLFGFHALQLGLPELDALRANRMPHRWLAVDTPALPSAATVAGVPGAVPVASAHVGGSGRGLQTAALHCDFDALPFDAASLDLVVLPHTLELARDPHRTLREVERVLVPEGRALIVGFNPASLWGVRQKLGRVRRRVGIGSRRDLFLPHAGEFIGHRRLRDWLRLLSFEVESGRFGCYSPPLRSAQWLARFSWMERTGERIWPVFGALYYIVAVKRVRGMRLVGLVRNEVRAKTAAPAPVAVSRRRELETAGTGED